MFIGFILAVVFILFVVSLRAAVRGRKKVGLSKSSSGSAARRRRSRGGSDSSGSWWAGGAGERRPAAAVRPAGTTGGTRAAGTRRAGAARPAEVGRPAGEAGGAAEAADTQLNVAGGVGAWGCGGRGRALGRGLVGAGRARVAEPQMSLPHAPCGARPAHAVVEQLNCGALGGMETLRSWVKTLWWCHSS